MSEILVFPAEQVLIRLIGADENIYTDYMDSISWLEDMNVLEMIVDKFSSSVSCLGDWMVLHNNEYFLISYFSLVLLAFTSECCGTCLVYF